MEKGQGKGTDTLQADNVFTRKEYIEREAVVELLNKWADGYSYIEVPTKDAIARVRVIPAADVESVRHGRWIDNKVAFYLGCSECGCYLEYAVDTFLDNGDHYHYCPNCGALMDKDGGGDGV